MLKIITDGSCRRNPGPAGWAALLRYGKHERLASGNMQNATNVQAEIMACINGLREVTREGQEIEIITDHKNIVGWMMEGWKRKSNQALLAELDAECAKHNVTFRHVKGHAGDPDNERVHQAAYQESGIALKVEQSQESAGTTHDIKWEDRQEEVQSYIRDNEINDMYLQWLKREGWPQHLIETCRQRGYRGDHLTELLPFQNSNLGIDRKGAYVNTPNGPGELRHRLGRKCGVLLDKPFFRHGDPSEPVMTFYDVDQLKPIRGQSYKVSA